MSMSRDCITIELEPNKWYCAVAEREYGQISDNEPFSVYGPALTSEDAFQMMYKFESNPGGELIIPQSRIGEYPELTALIKSKRPISGRRRFESMQVVSFKTWLAESK